MSQLSLKIAAARPEPPPQLDGRWAARADGADRLESWLAGPLGRSVRRRLPKGAHLFQEGAETDSLYFFLRGWAMKYKSLLDGRRQILDFVLPGEPLGFVVPQPAPYAVEMLNEAEIVAVSRRAFDALFESDPAFARAICRQLESSGARA